MTRPGARRTYRRCRHHDTVRDRARRSRHSKSQVLIIVQKILSAVLASKSREPEGITLPVRELGEGTAMEVDPCLHASHVLEPTDGVLDRSHHDDAVRTLSDRDVEVHSVGVAGSQ